MPDIKYNIIKNSEEYNKDDNEQDSEQQDDGYYDVTINNEEQPVVEEELHGELLHQWSFNEHMEHERGKAWYIVAGIFLILMSIYCVVTNNFLFLVIIIMSSLFIVMFKFKKPELLTFSIFEDGIKLEDFFYDWDSIKEYYIVYNPERKVKKIYFMFKKMTNPGLGIDLENENPLLIRETLNQYIQENTVRKYEHLSDQIERLFKL